MMMIPASAHTQNSMPSVSQTTGNTIDLFDPQRLNGLASHIWFEAESCKAKIKQLHSAISELDDEVQALLNVDQIKFLPSLEDTLKRTDAYYWLKLYDDTKLSNFMDTESYNEQNKALKNTNNIPPFTRENLINQIETFVGQAGQIFNKRVLTIFDKLSDTHTTNSAFGFRNRMIIDNCSSSYDPNYKSRYIHDLRCVIAMIRGEVEMPSTNHTSSILRLCFSKTNQWITVDGGALRIKGFKKGTVHIEISEESSDLLNTILASERPLALPEANKKTKSFKSTLSPVEIMLDNRVRDVLCTLRTEHPRVKNSDGRGISADTSKINLKLHSNNKDKSAVTQALNILKELYGEPTLTESYYIWTLNSDEFSNEAINHMIYVGTMPDDMSHQFYESTPRVQELVNELISIKETDEICEPSAGRGALAKLVPKNQTTCIEINSLNCFMLRGLGYKVKQECFLEYANKTNDRYDLFVMNPPYFKDLYWTHLKAAMSLLKPAGQIVAVVPSSVLGKKDLLPIGYTMVENHQIKEKFKGTSTLNISIITIKRTAVH